MRVKRSSYFIPMRRESEFSAGAGRMLRAGFISQHASGIYTWLGLGLRVLEKISDIINEEMQNAGAIKILMPTLQDAKLWQTTDRLDSFGEEMLKIKDRHERMFIYGPTAEEVVTELVSCWPLNKSSFPMNLYNIQWKFRDEIRPRFGVMRGREFLMKDAYSFHQTESCLMQTYQIMFETYIKIFSRLGLSVCAVPADTGAMGGFMSHEFQVLVDVGENWVKFKKWPDQPLSWVDRDNVVPCLESDPGATKVAEIGHIFALGDKYSRAFKACDPKTREPLLMGCYGIGVSRLVGLMFELAHSNCTDSENCFKDLGLVAPFKYTLISLQMDNPEVIEFSNKVFELLHEVIWDDREVSSGVKFAEADLLGSPIQIHIGATDLANKQVTLKIRGEKICMNLVQFFENLETDFASVKL